MAISSELEKIYDGSNLSATTIDTVELYHPSLSTRFYFCNHYENLKLNTETESVVFKSTSFGFKLPPQKKEGLGQFIFSFALFDAMILEELNSFLVDTKIPITLIYRVYTSNMLNAPASMLVYNIKVYEISIQNNMISLTGSMLSNLEKKIPKFRYSTEAFPGMRFF